MLAKPRLLPDIHMTRASGNLQGLLRRGLLAYLLKRHQCLLACSCSLALFKYEQLIKKNWQIGKLCYPAFELRAQGLYTALLSTGGLGARWCRSCALEPNIGTSRLLDSKLQCQDVQGMGTSPFRVLFLHLGACKLHGCIYKSSKPAGLLLFSKANNLLQNAGLC